MRAKALLMGSWLTACGVALWAQPPSPSKEAVEQTSPMPPASPDAAAAEPPPPAKPDGSIRFDPNIVERRQENGHWLLRSGTTLIKDFGPDGPAARNALILIRQQGVNELVWVGSP